MPGMLRVSFAAGDVGDWSIESISTICGAPLAPATRLRKVEGPAEDLSGVAWRLSGVQSHDRYVTRAEKERLAAIQPPLGRPSAVRAALIPIRKSQAWWALAQDERRELFEARSEHIAIGLRYLPAVARRLYHSRDLQEPFDFLTWFEFAEGDAPAFDELLARLRSTEEWTFVEREVEVRLRR